MEFNRVMMVAKLLSPPLTFTLKKEDGEDELIGETAVATYLGYIIPNRKKEDKWFRIKAYFFDDNARRVVECRLKQFDDIMVDGVLRQNNRKEIILRVAEWHYLWASPDKYVGQEHVLVERDEYQRCKALAEEVDDMYIPEKVREDLELPAYADPIAKRKKKC